jgi:hypothetical protein
MLFSLMGLWGFQPTIFKDFEMEVEDTIDDDDLLLLSAFHHEALLSQENE